MATDCDMEDQLEVNLEDKTELEPEQSHDNINSSCLEPEVDNEEEVLPSAPDARDKLIERLQRENKELLEAHKLNRQWEHKYFDLDVVNNDLRTKNDELEEELMECKEQIHNYRKLEISNKELQNLLQAREIRLKNLTNDNKNLHEQLEVFKENDTSAELEDMNRELELDNHKLKLSNIEMRCIIDAQVARVQIVEKEKVSLEEQLLSSQTKMKDFDHLQNVHNELKSLLAARDIQLAYLKKENNDLKSEVEYDLDKNGQIQAEKIELVKELDAQKERAENLKNDKYNLMAELEQTRKKLEDSMQNFEVEQKRFDAMNYRMAKIDDVLKKAKEIESLEKEKDTKLNDAEIENVRMRQEIGRLNALVKRLERRGSSEGDDTLASSSYCSMQDYEENSNRWSWHSLIRELVS